MARIVTAVVLYNGLTNEWVGDQATPQTININCERLQAYSPRPVWLQRWLGAGDGTLIMYQPTFELTSSDVAAYGGNMVQGLWIQQDNLSAMIDVASMSAFLEACNGCCDDDVAVPLARYYTSGVPAFSAPTSATYCIARVDAGDGTAAADFSLAYFSAQGVQLEFMRSHASGISYYQVTSNIVPQAIGTDVVTAGACVRQ